nr:hypothetical protein [Tanacetum cinerariifolium]
LDHTSKVLSMQEDLEVQEVVNAAKLITEVVTAATTQVIPVAEPVVATVTIPIKESLAQAKDAQTTDVQPKDAPEKGIQPIFQARFDANMRFLLKSKEEMEKEEEEIIKSINETPAQKAAKRRRLREQAKEAEDLKKKLEVVADEDDDVFVEATPI